MTESEQDISDMETKGMRVVTVGGVEVAVPEGSISLREEISRKKCAKYIKNSCVPVKDFGSLFKGVAHRFRGHLATIQDKKLKKLYLPIMTPAGVDLPDLPDEDADTIVVVSDDKWNGAILCSTVKDEVCRSFKFETSKNGDVDGTGVMPDGSSFLILNVPDLLRREGFLAMV